VGQMTVRWTEIDPAGHAAIEADSPPINPVVARGQGMQQTTDPQPPFPDQPDVWAMMKFRKRSCLALPRFDLLLENQDCVHFPGDITEDSRPMRQQGLQGTRRRILDVVQAAACPARHPLANLTQVDSTGNRVFDFGADRHGLRHLSAPRMNAGAR